MSEEKLKRMYYRVKDKNNHVTCCLNCHFSFEEKEALPMLPEAEQEIIKKEHKELLERYYNKTLNPKDVIDHAYREEKVFEKYCPPELLERIQTDHLKYCQDEKEEYYCDGYCIENK